MLRLEKSHRPTEIRLTVIGGLVTLLIGVVYARLVVIPYELGFVIITIGAITVYIGLFNLIKKLDSREPELKGRR